MDDNRLRSTSQLRNSKKQVVRLRTPLKVRVVPSKSYNSLNNKPDMRSLHLENTMLRKKLKEINELLKLKMHGKQSEQLMNQTSWRINSEQRINHLKKEKLELTQKVKKTTDYEYFVNVQEEIYRKEELISDLESQIKRFNKAKHEESNEFAKYKELFDEKSHLLHKIELVSKIVEENPLKIEEITEKHRSSMLKYAKLRQKLESLRGNTPMIERRKEMQELLSSANSGLSLSSLQYKFNELKKTKSSFASEISLLEEKLVEKKHELNRLRKQIEKLTEDFDQRNNKWIFQTANSTNKRSLSPFKTNGNSYTSLLKTQSNSILTKHRLSESNTLKEIKE